MRDPGVAGASEGKRIGVGNAVGFDDPLPGAQVPPEVGIDGVARGHSEQTEEKDRGERDFGAMECVKDSSHRRCDYRMAAILDRSVQAESG